MSDLLPQWNTISQAIVVVAAFSALVFVHELGHYLAARITGVRVERFFVGFDIFGIALKTEYKGTVYGIGILPLGGYCALAGQNDDPRKERRTGAADELQSKSLPARGLVFAGGVIMNFIFGFLILILAYSQGIPFIPAVVGNLEPGGPAATHGFEQGDRITRVNGKAVQSFEEASEAIALTGAGGEVEVELERTQQDGTAKTMTLRLKGRSSNTRGNLNSIGAEPARSRIVAGMVEDPIFAGRFKGKLKVGDEILAVNGTPIPPARGQLVTSLLRDFPGREAKLTVRTGPDGATRQIAVPLETYGEWDMGLRISITVAGVLENSPAAKAGLRPGDRIVACQLPDDDAIHRFPATRDFTALLAGSALRPVELSIVRGTKTIQAKVTPALLPSIDDAAIDTLLGIEGAMDADQGFLVDAVLDGSPAAAVLQNGDHITGINGAPLPRGKSIREAVEEQASKEIRLFVYRTPTGDEALLPARSDVPDANLSLRMALRIHPDLRRPMIGIDLVAGPIVDIEPESYAQTHLGGKQRLAGARLAAIQYSPDLRTTILRFLFPEGSPYGAGLQTLVADTPDFILRDPLAAGLHSRLPVSLKTAEEVHPLGLLSAIGAAAGKWVDLSLMTYKVIHRLIVRTLPLDAVGGPVQLFRIIKIADDRGFAYFLYIVALISVNLGVCNLLPFPVLDGGHLVFLLIEWIIGRPPPQAVRETAQWIGLACLLALMLTVTGYDLLYLFRG